MLTVRIQQREMSAAMRKCQTARSAGGTRRVAWTELIRLNCKNVVFEHLVRSKLLCQMVVLW